MSESTLDGPFGQALQRAGRIHAVSHPEDHGALVALARSGKPWMPIGSGLDGTVRPGQPVVAVHTRALPVRVSIDAVSGIARATANARWADVERHANVHGWSTEHLVDIHPGATVGGTLARRSLLPPLWLAGTARGACIGMEAIGADGAAYGYREAPRTSSGPDFRTLWFGAEGRNGVITRVSLELARQAPSSWFEVPLAAADWQTQRTWLDRYAGRASVVGGDATALLWRISGVGRVVDHACDLLAGLGHTVLPEATRPARRLVEVCVPWSNWDAAWAAPAAASIEPRVFAAGPTHVLLGAAGPAKALTAWAKRVATGPLSRWALRGGLEQGETEWTTGAGPLLGDDR